MIATAAELIEKARAAGVTLFVNESGDGVRVRPRPGERFLAELRAHKLEILEALRTHPPEASGTKVRKVRKPPSGTSGTAVPGRSNPVFFAEPSPKSHPCPRCRNPGFGFNQPGTICYWCRQKEHDQPTGEPCPGCGEACEACIPDHGGPHA